VNSHGRAHPVKTGPDARDAVATETTANATFANTSGQQQEGEIPQELLRKYILYAREKCRPKLYQIDQDKIARLFADMRRESLATGAYPITVWFYDCPSLRPRRYF
jgi:DNA replication licensing factor MCM2